MIKKILGAIAFYTIIPIPTTWNLQFEGIAKYAPLIGLGIGGLLGLENYILVWIGFGVGIRSVLIIASWIWITGGLHLDGAMDTADGLGVMDGKRRLEVMSDSRTGAYGVIVGIIIILLKNTALIELNPDITLDMMLVLGWGRWGQVAAIAYYPYLKATGKGLFHKTASGGSRDVVMGLVLLIGVSCFHQWNLIVVGGGAAIALLTGAYFNYRLAGHTGDTYGAVVEWTEALLLVWLTIFD